MLSHHIHHVYLSVKEMNDFLKVYRDEILPQSEQALKSSRAGYRVGSVDFLTLMDSEKQHFSNRISFENTLTKYYQAISMLEKNVGLSFSNWNQK